MSALQKQVTHYQIQESLGHWLPSWKYSSNWIEHQCWLDELSIYPEKNKIKRQKSRKKKEYVDLFWTPDILEIEKVISDTNIIDFPKE